MKITHTPHTQYKKTTLLRRKEQRRSYKTENLEKGKGESQSRNISFYSHTFTLTHTHTDRQGETFRLTH